MAACFLFLPHAPDSATAGVCDPLTAVSPSVTGGGTDYLPRLDLHPAGGVADACVQPLPDDLPGPVVFPVWAYNLQGQVTGARFRLFASAPIAGFAPSVDFVLVHAITASAPGGLWALDVEIAGEACGPVLLGEATATVPDGATAVFMDITGFDGQGAPVVTHAFKGHLPAVSPRHGAYAGAPDPYHCQLPLCREPHAPVEDFTPLQSGGFVIELGWRAGGGDYTMIRYRTDGMSPTSVFDGSLLTVVPTVTGQSYAVMHENPQVTQYWYTAFAVDLEGDTVTLGSGLECGSFTTATVDESIPATGASWGSVKQSYR